MTDPTRELLIDRLDERIWRTEPPEPDGSKVRPKSESVNVVTCEATPRFTVAS